MLDDARVLTRLKENSFSGVVCTMAMMNIADIGAVARSVRRVLEPGGWFVAVVTHPCFQTPETSWVTKPDGRLVCEVAGYFDERYWTSDSPDRVRSQVGDYHWTLSTYLNTFAGAGFMLERVDEPRASGRRLEQAPGNHEVPSILSLRFRSPADE